ncbi:hypothetical protein J3L18_22815 [Mucilaginibacter gossypii]|uniref:hypothetical protein n=1 Tax=Mucilaginibacter gossypii TaxID=551996 RepID=UPI000DCCC6C3|nr:MULTISPECIES: hypothetical protein [Mucilaginibacter]QTE35950.1 hypothetical protein J3L18_22815 [Mucilaginibacter gossypii]RAV56623.1 hypothetical protein DIU36_14570 [Mucilaginibacter rubeus]
MKILGSAKPVFIYLIKVMRSFIACLIFLACFLFLGVEGYAQEKDPASQLREMKSAQDSLTLQNPAEKIYVQLDKSIYTPGDTLWFKAYLFNAPTLNLSAKSGIMYVSIVTDSNVMVKKQRLPVEKGLSWGNISLKDIPAGTYTLIAYTQWLQNFSQDCFFRKQFTVADDTGCNWLANYTCSSVMADNKEQAHVKLLLSDIYKANVAGKPVQLSVLKGRRQLYRQAIQTDEKGLIDITFKLPAKPGDIRIVAGDGAGNHVNIPLNFNRPQDADVQFMPEGGELIAGLPAHVGFKAIGLDGKGINVSGAVLDHEKQVVANFESEHLGMGSFNLPVVNTGENYTAKVTLPGGAIREFTLPDVKKEGIGLNVINPPNEDSVKVLLSATDKIARSGESYFLIGKAREIICYGAMVDFKNGTSISQKINKKLFPSGITHFLLLDKNNKPLNERLIFINRHDNLHLNINADKMAYNLRDSIALHISAQDALGNPLRGNFSMAVTDDAQVHQDSLSNENIVTRMLLTSELKGFVEQPNYYLIANNSQAKEALDNLLLTQGWVSYNWPDGKDNPGYAAETETAVKGRVINVFNKPVKQTKVQLFSKSPVVVTDTLTDKDGRFAFRNLPLADTPAYFIKTAKKFNVGIVMDDAPPPVLLASAGPTPMPWYVSNDTTLFNSLKNNRIRQNLADNLPADTKALKEVKITAKKIVKGSQNLNGAGNADLAFDEGDMVKAGKKSLLNFLEQHVPNLKWGTLTKQYNLRFALQDKSKDEISAIFQFVPIPPTPTIPWYLIDNKPMMLIVDGISFGSVIKVMSLNEPNGNDIKSYLESNTAEDVKGIEVNSSSKYSWEYFWRYILEDWKHSLNPAQIAFVEITTRSGKGPAIGHTPGAYLYKPLALSVPSRFYRPRYLPDNTNKHTPDLRSTIHWEPNVTTGADGKATISFYTADKPSTYTYILEGTNMDGSVGYTYGKIKVTGNTNP